MTLYARIHRVCRTEHCESEPRARHVDDVAPLLFGYCDRCIAIVLRTGHPPVIAKRPPWFSRLKAKDWTGAA